MTLAIDMIGTSLGSGTKSYNLNFCKHVCKNNLEEKIYIFITQDYLDNLNVFKNHNINFIIKSSIFTNIFFRLIWMQLFLPFELKRLKVDQLFSPMNMCPLILKILRIKNTLALHSNLPWVYFKYMPGNLIRNIFTKYLIKLSINFCDKLIVPSEFAKNEIIEKLKLDKQKVFSVYLGIDERYLLSESKSYIKDFDYSSYIISVLSCVRYHNIINLLKGFKQFKKKTNSNIKFVLVMQILDKNYFNEVKSYISQNFSEGEIIFFHNLSGEYLVNLYKKAKLYIFTSYCEVFGLTSLEAMSQGCPVLISNRSALKEVNSKAVHYFDPDDNQKIYEGIKIILEDKDYRDQLISRGDKHFKKFNWDKTVKETLKILNN